MVDVSDPQRAEMLGLAFRATAAISMAVASWLGVLGARQRRRARWRPRPAPRQERPTLRPVDPGDVLPIEASLATFIAQSRAQITELLADDDRIVEPGIGTHDVQLNLEWISRRGTSYVDSPRERINLFDIHRRFNRVVLLGDPGSGKSTCLRQLALAELDRLEQALAGGAEPDKVRIPFYVSLSEWVDPTMTAHDFLQSRLSELLGRTNYITHHFEAILTSGRFLLLLDGLNELPGRRAHQQEGRQEEQATPVGPGPARIGSVDQREASLRQLAGRAGLQSRWVMSCRSHDYYDSLRWQVVRVLPMDQTQVAQFVHRYVTDPSTAHDLIAMLRADDRLAAIASNPFFLRSIIVAYQPGLKLRSRGDVLYALLNALLERERVRHAPATIPSTDSLIRLAGRVAFEMLDQGHIGNQAAIQAPTWNDAAASELVRTLVDTGLVTTRSGQYYFCHQIVQEFFAALALNKRIVRRGVARLLAEKRFTEVVALWYDLDPDRLYPRLTRCLRARNLPWRRPRAQGSTLLAWYQIVTSTALVFFITAWLVDRLLWPVPTLAAPVRIPWPSWMVLAAMLAVRPVWKSLVYHPRIIANAAHALSMGTRPVAALKIVPALGRISRGLFGAPSSTSSSIASSLARFGSTATPHIIAGLGSRNWKTRVGCAEALGHVLRLNPHDRLATEVVLALAELRDRDFVRAVADALTWSSDPRATRALARLLNPSRRPAREAIAFAIQLAPLGAALSTRRLTGDAEVLRLFDDILDVPDPNPNQIGHVLAVRIIGALRIAGAEERLAALARDTSRAGVVRAAAVAALADTGTTESLRQMLQLVGVNDIAPIVLRHLRAISDPARIDLLIPVADKGTWWVRWAIAVPVGAIGTADSAHRLAEWARDPNASVRVAAAQGLGVAGRPEAAATLAMLARDQAAEVRAQAVEQLCANYPEAAPGVLAELVVDRSYPDRLDIVHRLPAYADPEVDAALHQLAADPSRKLRKAARRILRSRQRKRGSVRFAALRRRLAWDELRELWRAEKRSSNLSGASLFSQVAVKVLADAELNVRYRTLIALVATVFTILFALSGALVFAVFKLALIAAAFLLPYWFVVLPASAVAVATWLPGIRALRSVPVIGWLVALLRGLLVLLGVTALTAAIVYTWWVWLVLAAVAIVVYRLILRASRRARRRRLRAAVARVLAAAPIDASAVEVEA